MAGSQLLGSSVGVAVSLHRSQPCSKPQPKSLSSGVRHFKLALTRESQSRLQATEDSRPLQAQRRELLSGNCGIAVICNTRFMRVFG